MSKYKYETMHIFTLLHTREYHQNVDDFFIGKNHIGISKVMLHNPAWMDIWNVTRRRRRRAGKTRFNTNVRRVPLLQAQSNLCFSPNSAEDCFCRRGLHLAAAAAVYILGMWSSTILLQQPHQKPHRRQLSRSGVMSAMLRGGLPTVVPLTRGPEIKQLRSPSPPSHYRLCVWMGAKWGSVLLQRTKTSSRCTSWMQPFLHTAIFMPPVTHF